MLANPSRRCCGETVMAETCPLRGSVSQLQLNGSKAKAEEDEGREKRLRGVGRKGSKGERATHCQSLPRPSVFPITVSAQVSEDEPCCSIERGRRERTVAHQPAALASAERAWAPRPARRARATHVDLGAAACRLDDPARTSRGGSAVRGERGERAHENRSPQCMR